MQHNISYLMTVTFIAATLGREAKVRRFDKKLSCYWRQIKPNETIQKTKPCYIVTATISEVDHDYSIQIDGSCLERDELVKIGEYLKKNNVNFSVTFSGGAGLSI